MPSSSHSADSNRPAHKPTAGILSLFAAVCALSTACTKPTGKFADDGFHYAKQPIRVQYAAAGERILVGPEWHVENYQYRDGKPHSQKVADSYLTTYYIDARGDGKLQPKQVPRNDLVLKHRRHDATIWLRLIPVSSWEGTRDLLPIARNFVDEAAGPSVVVQFHKDGMTASERNWATRLTELRSCTMAGKPAVLAEYEAATVEQIKLDPTARTRQVRFLLVRGDYDYDFQGVREPLPTLLMAGYSNRPADFAELSPDFDKFIVSIQLGTGDRLAPSGWASGLECGPSILAQEPPPTETAAPSTPARAGDDAGSDIDRPSEAPTLEPGDTTSPDGSPDAAE